MSKCHIVGNLMSRLDYVELFGNNEVKNILILIEIIDMKTQTLSHLQDPNNLQNEKV